MSQRAFGSSVPPRLITEQWARDIDQALDRAIPATADDDVPEVEYMIGFATGFTFGAIAAAVVLLIMRALRR